MAADEPTPAQISRLFIDANSSPVEATVTQSGRWHYEVCVSAGARCMYLGLHWGRRRAQSIARRKVAKHTEILRQQRQWRGEATVIRSVDDD